MMSHASMEVRNTDGRKTPGNEGMFDNNAAFQEEDVDIKKWYRSELDLKLMS
jgi:hypothetical protein